MRADAASVAALQSVTGAIQQAARSTGTSFRYLLATAQVESGLDPRAAAPTSSAKGLYQFIDQTWLGTMKQAGPGLGYGRYADAIRQSPDGRFHVSDPAQRKAILALRQDPTVNAALAGAFTKQNSEYLTARLGRAPSDAELYMAHFFGAGGAAKLIRASEQQPGAAAAAMFPGAARANPPIFYGHDGQPRSTAGVYHELARRYDRAVASPVPAAQVALAFAAQDTAAPPSASAPAVAAIAAATGTQPAADTLPANASAFVSGIPDGRRAASGTAPVFFGLFQDGARGPISPVVAQLWGGQAVGDVKAAAQAAAVTGPAAVRAATPAGDTPGVTGSTQAVTQPAAPGRITPAASSNALTGGLSRLFSAIGARLRALFGG